MNELVVISGKGGTGKTSLTASFARLAGRAALADCDVDAADLHLVVAGTLEEEHEFVDGKVARIVAERCSGCGRCLEVCRFDAVSSDPWRIDPGACEGCGLCARVCPAAAVAFEPVPRGSWRVSRTAFGPMVDARLLPGGENSGRLVTKVREEARRRAGADGLDLLLVDGAPGIGCPVIASLAGASLVLVVTEPTVSGVHDLGRVLDLAAHFRLPTAVCVNKWDLNPEMTTEATRVAGERGARAVFRVRYDRSFTRAQLDGLSVVDVGRGEGAAADVAALWDGLQGLLAASAG